MQATADFKSPDVVGSEIEYTLMHISKATSDQVSQGEADVQPVAPCFLWRSTPSALVHALPHCFTHSLTDQLRR